jgi:group I intron endonuclease
MGFIYKIINLITNKVYIGKTTESCPEKRWKRHCQAITRGSGCPALRDAILKYGIQNFKFQVIIICFDESTSELEKEYIKRNNSIVPNGYNITPGGEGGGFIGKSHSDKTKLKLSITAKKLFNNQDRIKECSERTKKYYELEGSRQLASERLLKSEKWKKALSEGRVGTNKSPPTAETKEKIRIGLLKYNEKLRADSLRV